MAPKSMDASQPVPHPAPNRDENILTDTLRAEGDLAIAANTQTATSKDPQGSSLEPLEVLDGEQNGDDIVYPTGTKFASILMAIGLACFVVGLDGSILSTAVPTITTEFKTTADIGWYVAAFRLTLMSFQFMFGKIYQLFSVKIVFITSCAIFELGSLLCGVAPNSNALIIGRAVCGIGTSAIIQGVFTMAMQSVPLRQRSIYAGIGAGIEAVANVSGPLLGGIITQSIGWRWCFYMNLPLGAITIFLVIFFFQDPQVNPNILLPWKQKLQRLDILGTIIFIPSMTTLLLGLQYGGTRYPWNDVRVIILFVASAISIAGFMYLQYRNGDNATIPPRIITQRSILAGCLFSCMNNASLNIIEYYMPIWFQTVKQTSVSKSGVMILPSIIGLGISVVLGGAGTSIFGYYTPFMLITSLLVPIAAGLMTTLKVDAKLASLIIYQGLLGFGAGIGFQGPQVAVQTLLSQGDAPLGIAIIQFAQGFGPAVFVPIGQVIFQNRVSANLVQYAPNVNATYLDNLGLLDLKDHFDALDLKGLLLCYDMAITRTFYLALALSCLTLVGSLGVEWKSVKQKKN